MKEIKTLPPGKTAAVGGVGVIFVTATAAMTGMGANYHMEPIDWLLFGFVALLGLIGSIAMARFIRNNPGAIGEARFDTSHADEESERS
jgi:hypothetical protein